MRSALDQKTYRNGGTSYDDATGGKCDEGLDGTESFAQEADSLEGFQGPRRRSDGSEHVDHQRVGEWRTFAVSDEYGKNRRVSRGLDR